MKVLKFGGTSVGTPQSMANVKAIVESQTEQVVVVVSALGGLTDNLIATAKMAASADEAYRDRMNAIFDRHHDMVEAVIEPERRADVLTRVNHLLQELADTYDSIYATAQALETPVDPDRPTMDLIVSFGERVSSIIVSEMLPKARLVDSLKVVKTRPHFEKHILDSEPTERLIHEAFDDFTGAVTVCPGFISTDSATGAITNLGRGGSDYTAAIIAAALNATTLEIWTDVDGFMTADPRMIPSAYVIKTMTFVEAMELCNFGAKVIYPPTIYPVFHKNIPIFIKNTFNPSAPGTLIDAGTTGGAEEGVKICGLSTIKATGRIIVGVRDAELLPAVFSSALNALARHGLTYLFPTRSAADSTLTITFNEADLDKAVAVLNQELSREIASGEIIDIERQDNLSVIAIVGDRLNDDTLLTRRIESRLQSRHIGIVENSGEPTRVSVAVEVEGSNLTEAMNELHDEFFGDSIKAIDIMVAGDETFMNLVAERAAETARTTHISFRPTDTVNDKTIIVDLRGSVAQYPQWLMQNATIVTTTALPDDVYKPLAELSEKGKGRLLTATRSLPAPIVQTLKAINASGDEIISMAFESMAIGDETIALLRNETAMMIAPTVDSTLAPGSITIRTRRFPDTPLTLTAPIEPININKRAYDELIVAAALN